MRIFLPPPNGPATCIVDDDGIYFIDGWLYDTIKHHTLSASWADEWIEVEVPDKITHQRLRLI